MADFYSKPTDSNLFGFDAPKDFDSSRDFYSPETLKLGSIYGNMSSIGAQLQQMNDFAFLPRKDGGSQEDTTMEDIQPSPRGSDHVFSDISPGTFSSFSQFSCPPSGSDFTLFPDKQFCAFNAFLPGLESEMTETARALDPDRDMKTAQGQEVLSSEPSSFSVNSPSLKLETQDPVFPKEHEFRFLTTLHTPTAMTGSTDEPPVSYLNRNSVYSLSVRDNAPVYSSNQLVKYRTTVRVEFDQQERSDPSAYWELWREARVKGDVESQQSAQAIDYVGQGSNVAIEQRFFDGFSVTWVGNPALLIPGCKIFLRFNFLSTDFTRSKGVKGIPLRLCAKTTQISMENTPFAADQPDTYYCRIKLFRDHGAERKLSNDRTNIMKAIEKAKKETFFQDDLKKPKLSRKRGDSSPRRQQGQSMFVQPKPLSLRESELAKLQKAMSSAQPQSVLSLRVDEKDDPNRSIVRWPGGNDEVGKEATTLGLINERQCSRFSSTESGDSRASLGQLSPADVKDGSSSDTTPASCDLAKQNDRVACLYARLVHKGHSSKYHRAIYLQERTVRDLAKNLVRKFSTRSLPVARVLYMNAIGLKVVVDDDFVREIPEGQDIIFHMEQAGDCLEIQLFF